MNSTEHIHRAGSRMNRLMKWPLLCGLLGLAPVALVAGDFAGDTYINNAIVSYPGTETHPPMIDATNFINNGTFTINFTTISLTQPFYETSDTVNYTNNGAMTANTGFRFDTRYSGGTGLRAMAGSFNNQGTITNASTIDLLSLENLLSLDELNLILGFGGYGYCLVNATNIVNPGVVDAGAGGLIQFTGQNVDLSRSTLNLEGSGANTFGSGVFGVNTNKFLTWDPSLYLGATFAESAYFPIAPFYLNLTNSTAYIHLPANQSSNNVIKAVFIEDNSVPSVPYNVYFGADNEGNGSGGVTIEWAGTYQDAATGNTYGNYLYLNNNYELGSSTNVLINGNGIPDNFIFTASPTQLPIGVPPATPGFVNVFPAGAITNSYSYGNINLISSSVSTNEIQNLAVTNLPGRIEISAANELNLATARLTGASYVSVQAPNQFDGSPGALIQAPYADLNLGVTNGFLTVSNLLAPSVPNWNGTIQAWSTRWVTVDSGVTNDYRVLIVGSQLTPTTLSQVQDLILHGTNSIVISDVMNVTRTFTADAKNLTLATNGIGNGATSLSGELNLQISGTSSWASALPNLRNLTNNGAIRFQNLVQFAGQSNIYTITPETPAAAATGTLAEVAGSNVAANNKVVIGTNQYVFVSSLVNGTPNQVKVASKFDGSMSNLIAAINLGAGAGSVYSSSTRLNAQVAAGTLTNHAFTVTARAAGSAGNSILTALSTTAVNLAWTGAVTNHLSGGADFMAGTTNITSMTMSPYDNFINQGLVSDQGSTVWANNFENGGAVSNGFGSFALTSMTTTLTNGSVTGGGDIVISADSLVASNVVLQAGKSLTLSPTNFITDGGLTNGNVWSVGGASGVGFNLLVKPLVGDLLGTTVSNTAPASRTVVNTWAAHDFGATTTGYTNNAAVGRLILDAFGAVPQNGVFAFAGTGTSNAMYVDYLELKDSATNRDISGNAVALSFGPNVVLYYAQAMQNGQSVAEKLNHKNGDHLRWVPTYTGYYSSTNLVYPSGVTNTLNQALVQSTSMDSDGDGTVNAFDSTPVFVPGQVNFGLTVTNLPPLSVRVQWVTIPHATNFIYYTTNLAAGTWLPFTNFNQYYYGANVAVTNAAHGNSFVSPQGYPSPATNVWLFDTVTNTPHYYQVVVVPWLTYPF